MKLLVLMSCLVFSVEAFSYTYVKCGKSVDFENFVVSGYELELSSESDDYMGTVGGTWNLKLKSEDSDWLPASRNITAQSSIVDGDTIIQIIIIFDRTPSGPVGLRYKLIGLYDDAPVLEKYTMGGFAGSVKTATFECFSGND